MVNHRWIFFQMQIITVADEAWSDQRRNILHFDKRTDDGEITFNKLNSRLSLWLFLRFILQYKPQMEKSIKLWSWIRVRLVSFTFIRDLCGNMTTCSRPRWASEEDKTALWPIRVENPLLFKSNCGELQVWTGNRESAQFFYINGTWVL